MTTEPTVIDSSASTAFPIAVFDEFGKSIDDAVQNHVDAHLDRLRTRIAALVEAAREVAGAFDVESGQFCSALKYSDYIALHAALKGIAP